MKRIILAMVCAVWATAYINAQVNNAIVTTASPAITTGDDNTGIGASIFTTVTTGSRNTFIGNTAGDGAVSNDDNTYVGYGATGSNGLNEAAAIGAGATVGFSHTMILGRVNDPTSTIPNVNVGIGSTAAPAKLTVYNGSDPTFIPGFVGGSASTIETYDCIANDHDFDFADVNIMSVSLTGTNASVGTVSLASGGALFNAGILALGANGAAEMNAGIVASAGGTDADRNFGVWGDVIVDDGLLNIAVAGIVDDGCGQGPGSGARSNYGVYGSCDPGNIGSTATTDNYAGYFAGHVITTAATYHTSDSQLKENISSLSSSLEKLKQLKFYTYSYKRNQFPQMNLAAGSHYGLLAQELEKVFPELVTNTSFMETKLNGKTYTAQQFKAVNYTELIPITMKAVQELDAKLEALNTLLAENGIDVSQLNSATKGDIKTAYLEQNAPNPASGETVIRYFAPESVSKVMLVVMGVNGEVVKKDATLATGKQELKIRAGDLKDGVYFYSLFCDNELVATKKMILVSK